MLIGKASRICICSFSKYYTNKSEGEASNSKAIDEVQPHLNGRLFEYEALQETGNNGLARKCLSRQTIWRHKKKLHQEAQLSVVEANQDIGRFSLSVLCLCMENEVFYDRNS